MTTSIFSKNQKMKETEEANPGTKFLCFNLPAITTCPNAGECAKWCYARQGRYTFSTVKNAQQYRLDLTKECDFTKRIQDELDRLRTDKYNYFIRLHDSGDFYSEKYFADWVWIALSNPHITFYAYTKMVSMIKKASTILPPNMIIIFSYGGKEDLLIDQEKDRHSRVFNTVEELKEAGYVDATGNDHVAIANMKVGLPIHGSRKMRIDENMRLIE